MEKEKRLIDANTLHEELSTLSVMVTGLRAGKGVLNEFMKQYRESVLRIVDEQPTVDAVEVVHGRWEITAHEECSNYRWNVTAECSKCHHSKGEIYAGFFPGFPKELARSVVLDCAKSVKLDNYCPNCGAKMDGDGNA